MEWNADAQSPLLLSGTVPGLPLAPPVLSSVDVLLLLPLFARIRAGDSPESLPPLFARIRAGDSPEPLAAEVCCNSKIISQALLGVGVMHRLALSCGQTLGSL